jgi:hypothetical protein
MVVFEVAYNYNQHPYVYFNSRPCAASVITFRNSPRSSRLLGRRISRMENQRLKTGQTRDTKERMALETQEDMNVIDSLKTSVSTVVWLQAK